MPTICQETERKIKRKRGQEKLIKRNDRQTHGQRENERKREKVTDIKTEKNIKREREKR